LTDTTTRPSPSSRADLAAEVAAEAAVLERELGEVELLLGQVRTEAQRHEARRLQTSERFDTLLRSGRSGDDLREAHEQLMVQSKRAALMDAQLEVLEGKQKVLRRFSDYLAHTIQTLGGLPAGALAEVAGGSTVAGAGGEASSRSVLEAQEEMRRQIARQMHDGPAQSIANIALQAEVVQRLLRQDASAGERELNALRDMVEHALEETKAFIFDVRPMVLDDLGLMPTLRRAAQDRARRTGRRIRFESLGADRRLDPEHESALFRIVDDAVTGYVESQPDDVLIRLAWSDDEVTATVVCEAPPTGKPAPAKPKPADKQPAAALPPALAAMIDEQHEREQSRAAVSLPVAILSGIRSRAAAAGIEVSISADGRSVSATSDSATPSPVTPARG
jgi:two-component system, NarL family, sensor histidine kinase DegS